MASDLTSSAPALSPPTTRGPSWLLLAVVCVGQFMVVLDLSIVNVALPAMQRDLHFSTTQLQWVVNAYALTFGGFLLLGGRAADLFGRRKIFVLGLAMFSGASLICALAPNEGLLIAARALQGLGAAVLSPATLTILTTTFREAGERARALGIWSAMAAVGGASGALFGGVLTDLLSWRWIFYINVPIGLVTIVAARTALVDTKAEGHRPKLDVVGALTVTGALVAFVYAIAGTDTHSWGSATTLIPIAMAAVLLAVFVTVEMRMARTPLVPFRLFRSRAVTGANLAMLLVGGAIFAMWLFLSLYMQEVLRFSPLITGVGFLPQTAAIALGAQIAARLVPRFGPRPPLLVGVLLATVGLAWLSRISPTGHYASDVLGGSVLATLGMGLSFTPLAFAATSGVAREEAGLASGMLNTSRQVGGSIALAALATLAAARAASVLSAHHVAALGISASRSSAARALPQATRAMRDMALTSGFSRVFLVSAAIALAGFLAALLIPGKPAHPAAVLPGAAASPADARTPAPAAVGSAAKG
jgi:EmrB/QacA subfamily drug resistance transporter